jgi:RNA polymerase sigma-70 factor (ECF subfamily)
MTTEDRSAVLENYLKRLHEGDTAVREELLRLAAERLTELTRTMLRNFRRLRRWEQTDDVLQGALLRLHRALAEVAPPTPRDFYRLATAHIRRELIDLSRRHFGPEGLGANQESAVAGAGEPASPPPDPGDTTLEPASLAVWGDFHRQAEALPAEEQEVFDLVWYQGLKHTEAAAVLNVSARTVKRRWQSACLRLHQALGDNLPGL